MPRCFNKNAIDFYIYNLFDYIVPTICKLDIHPNIITLSGLIPIYYFYIDMRYNNKPYRALLWLLLTQIIDCLDGEVARQCNKQTNFGSKFDGFVDSIRLSICIHLFLIIVLQLKLKNELFIFIIIFLVLILFCLSILENE